MEMNFPHFALRQEPDSNRVDLKAVLDAARLRQANSRTVKALRQAEEGNLEDPDDLAARIHYFALESQADMPVRGSFWQKADAEKLNEETVYQAALANVKDQALSTIETGTELNQAGHGALQKP